MGLVPGHLDVPGPYLLGTHLADARRTRKQRFDVDSEALPEHLCELLIKTMTDVYGRGRPALVLEWDGPGRPPPDRPADPGHVRVRLRVREVQ